ncbi:hypothetical protein [Mycoplasmoides fastidiosum]|nr:hypothetical protein [Mycoplasmoides fastidiosum]
MNLIAIWLGSMVLSACAENAELSHPIIKNQEKKPENSINRQKNLPESDNNRNENRINPLDKSHDQIESNPNDHLNFLEKSEIKKENYNSKNNNLVDENLTTNKLNDSSNDTKKTKNNENQSKNETNDQNLIKNNISSSKQNNELIDTKKSNPSKNKLDVFPETITPRVNLEKDILNTQITDDQRQKVRNLLNTTGAKIYFLNQITSIKEYFLTNLDVLSQVAYFDQSELIEQLKQLVATTTKDNLNLNQVENFYISPIKELEKLIQNDQNINFSEEQKNNLIKILEELFTESTSLLNSLISFSEKEEKISLNNLQTKLNEIVTKFAFTYENDEKINLNQVLTATNNYYVGINEIIHNLANLKDVAIRVNNKTLELENFIESHSNLKATNFIESELFQKLILLKNGFKINILKHPISDFFNSQIAPLSFTQNYDFKSFDATNLKLYKINDFINSQTNNLQKFLESIKILIYNKSLIDFNESAIDLLAANWNKNLPESVAKIKSYWNNNKSKIDYLLKANTDNNEFKSVLTTVATEISNNQIDALIANFFNSYQPTENSNSFIQVWEEIRNILFTQNNQEKTEFPLIKNVQDLMQKIMNAESYGQILEIFSMSEELLFMISHILETFANSSDLDATISIKNIINEIIGMNDSNHSHQSKNEILNLEKLKKALKKLQQISNNSLTQSPLFFEEMSKLNQSNDFINWNKELALAFNNGKIDYKISKN